MTTRAAVAQLSTITLLIGLFTIGSLAKAETSGDFKAASAAAAKGDARSQTVLGNMYHDGWGVAKDITKAIEWYRKAADQGYADGQFALGHEYATGHGVPADASNAIELFHKAAEQGHAQAQYRLGKYHHEGKHLPADEQMAVKWYAAAAKNGSPDGQLMMGYYHLSQEEPSRALAFFEEAAPRNDTARSNAAWLYAMGEGTSVDYAKAASYAYLSSSKELDAKALYGYLLLEGKGVYKDVAKGAKHLKEAAESGHSAAMYWLAEAMYDGVYISDGMGMVAADSGESVSALMKKEARKWYEKAAADGDEDAQKRLRENYR